MATTSPKMDKVLDDIQKANKIQEQAASESISDLSKLSSTLSGLDPKAVEDFLTSDQLQEFQERIAQSGEDMNEIVQKFDTILKASRDISAVQQSTGMSFKDSADALNKMYEATIKALEAEKEQLSISKLSTEQRAAQVSKNKELINYNKDLIDSNNEIISQERSKLSLAEEALLNVNTALKTEKKGTPAHTELKFKRDSLKEQIREANQIIAPKEAANVKITKQTDTLRQENAALSGPQKAEGDIDNRIAQLTKLKAVQGQVIEERARAHKEYLAQINKEKAENLSLSKLLSEKFGKEKGSEALGALMGGKVGGSLSNLLLAKIGQSTGIAGKLEDSSLAKIFAKGFDISDANKKILDNSTKELNIATQAKEETVKTRTSIMTNAALTVGVAALGAHALAKTGIIGAGSAIKTVESFAQPGGYEKAFYGGIGQFAGSKIFGEKAGLAIGGMVGAFVDALIYDKQKALDSAVFSQIMKQQGGQSISLKGADMSGKITAGEAQDIGNRYSTYGRQMGGLADYTRMLSFDRTYGQDVMDQGFQNVGKGLSTSDTIASRIGKTFRDIRDTVIATGGSVKEVTKQLFAAAEGARFLNVDIRAVQGFYKDLFSADKKRDLMAVGVDVKNPGAALSNILQAGASNPALGMLLQGADREKYGSGLDALGGTFFRLKSEDLGIIKQGEKGWSIDESNQDVIKAKQSLIRDPKGFYRERTASEKDDAVVDLMKSKGKEYAKNQLENLIATARSAHPTDVFLQGQVLKSLDPSITDESVKILLKEGSLDTKEGNKILDDLLEEGKSDNAYLKDLASSATVAAKTQANTNALLIDVLSFLIALPPFLDQLFTGGDSREAMADVGKSMAEHIKGVQTSFSNPQLNKVLNLEFYKGKKELRSPAGQDDLIKRIRENGGTISEVDQDLIWKDVAEKESVVSRAISGAVSGATFGLVNPLKTKVDEAAASYTTQAKVKDNSHLYTSSQVKPPQKFGDPVSAAENTAQKVYKQQEKKKSSTYVDEAVASKEVPLREYTQKKSNKSTDTSNIPPSYIAAPKEDNKSIGALGQGWMFPSSVKQPIQQPSKSGTDKSYVASNSSYQDIVVNFNSVVLADEDKLKVWVVKAINAAKKQGLVS